MIQRPSPFICGGPVPPAHFVGREEQVDAIMGQLTGPARGGSAVSGERRIGKTSLLHYLASPSVAEEWGVPTESWHFVLVDCQEADLSTSATPFWRRVFLAMTDSLPDDLAQRARALARGDGIEESVLGRFFDDVARRDNLIVLMLDEFESVTRQADKQNPEVLYQLRQLLNRPWRGLALITASREPVDMLCREIRFQGSPFYNNLLSVWLPPFDGGEVVELLDRAVPAFSGAERAYILRIAGRHPLLLQLAADELYRSRARLRSGQPLDWADVGRDYERRARPHYRDLWREMQPRDRMLLALIALRTFHEQTGGRGYEVRDIEGLLVCYRRSLRSLAERGFVTDASPPAVVSSVGQWWLIEEIASSEDAKEGWQQFLSRQELSRVESAIRAVQVNQSGIKALIEWAVEPSQS